MSDYIVGKKYRLLELHPTDTFNRLNLKGSIFVCEKEMGVFKNAMFDEFYFLGLGGYPKMELVEEEEPAITEIVKKHRIRKKHYRFKSREYKQLKTKQR